MRNKKFRRKTLTSILSIGVLFACSIIVSADYNFYILPQSSSEYLDGGDIAGMSQQELNYARNEIYARHGRCFLSQELTDYFNQMSWYSGTIAADAFDQGILNKYEQQNAEYLKSIEYNNDADGYALNQQGYDIYKVISANSSNISSYVIADSSSRYLDYNEISGMSAKDLCYARNEIYARHGRKFISKELTGFFNSKSWYTALYEADEFPVSKLSAIENANITLLKEREYELCPGGYVLDQASRSGTYTEDQASQAIKKFCERYLGQGGMTYISDEYLEGDTYVLWFRWGTGFTGKYEASLLDGGIYESGPYLGRTPHEELPFSKEYVGNISDFR